MKKSIFEVEDIFLQYFYNLIKKIYAQLIQKLVQLTLITFQKNCFLETHLILRLLLGYTYLISILKATKIKEVQGFGIELIY